MMRISGEQRNKVESCVNEVVLVVLTIFLSRGITCGFENGTFTKVSD